MPRKMKSRHFRYGRNRSKDRTQMVHKSCDNELSPKAILALELQRLAVEEKKLKLDQLREHQCDYYRKKETGRRWKAHYREQDRQEKLRQVINRAETMASSVTTSVGA